MFRAHSSFLCLCVAAISCCVGCDPPARIVNTDEGRLTVVEKSETTSDYPAQASYKVEPSTSISRDGEPATLEELGQGDAVQVVATQQDGERVALEIVAQSNAQAELLHPSPQAPQPEPDVAQPPKD